MSDDGYAELAARIERLEQRLAADDTADRADTFVRPASEPDDADRLDKQLWLLEELRRRASRPVMIYGGRAEVSKGPVAWQMGADSAELLDTEWDDRAPRIAALGHPARLRVLQLVLRGTATTAAELSRTEGLGTTGQVYHHLRQLTSAGWLRAGSRGVHEVPAERVIPLLIILAAAS